MSNGEYRVGLDDSIGQSNYLLESFPAWSLLYIYIMRLPENDVFV